MAFGVIQVVKNGGFQLTHPSRGVANSNHLIHTVIKNFNSHTPREVWPAGKCQQSSAVRYFNSHTPREVWLNCSPTSNLDALFQLTHPSRGVASKCARIGKTNYFNSHTPREVWLGARYYYIADITFQLTHPSRGVAAYSAAPSIAFSFQLTHPSRGVAS